MHELSTHHADVQLMHSVKQGLRARGVCNRLRVYDTLAAYDTTTKPLGEAIIESVTRVSRRQLNLSCELDRQAEVSKSRPVLPGHAVSTACARRQIAACC